MTDTRNWCDDCVYGLVCPLGNGLDETRTNFNLFVKQKATIKIPDDTPAIRIIIQGCMLHKKDDEKVKVVK